MKSFIEELYCGNIDPQDSGILTGFRLGARFVLDTIILPEASPQNYLQDNE